MADQARVTEAAKRPRQKPAGVTNLSGLLDYLETCCVQHDGDRVAVGDLLDALGRRSFGPIILLLGLIGLAPVSNIPGVVAVVATLDLLVITEILIGMDHVWIPGFLARRSMAADKLSRTLQWMRKPARIVDRFLRPRLTFATEGLGFYATAWICMLVAIALPFIEIVPLAGIVPNAALVAFGLAFTAHDGLWAMIGITITAVSAYLLAMLF